jgi:hypothetical protein
LSHPFGKTSQRHSASKEKRPSEKEIAVHSRSVHSHEGRAQTTTADKPLDTAALLAIIALIGLIVFLLWM